MSVDVLPADHELSTGTRNSKLDSGKNINDKPAPEKNLDLK
jgi:hypothetical protein